MQSLVLVLSTGSHLNPLHAKKSDEQVPWLLWAIPILFKRPPPKKKKTRAHRSNKENERMEKKIQVHIQNMPCAVRAYAQKKSLGDLC